MRRYAVTALLLADRDGDGGMRVERPDGCSTFGIREPEFRTIARADTEAMTFEQALLFARHGRAIQRRGWDASHLGPLWVYEGQLVWALDGGMTVVLPSEDLLASDWQVMP